jgi:hypothetical protein
LRKGGDIKLASLKISFSLLCKERSRENYFVMVSFFSLRWDMRAIIDKHSILGY